MRRALTGRFIDSGESVRSAGGLKRLKAFRGLLHDGSIGLEALRTRQGVRGSVQIVPVHLGVGDPNPGVDTRRIGLRRPPERGERVGRPIEVGEDHRHPHQRPRVARIALHGGVERRDRGARIAAAPQDEPQRLVCRTELRVERHRALRRGPGLGEMVLVHVGGGQIDVRLEPIGFTRDHLFEQRHGVVVTPGGDVDLSEVRHQHQIVRLVPAELLQDPNRRRKLSGDDIGGRVAQQRGVSAAEAEHLVCPRIAPLGFTACANARRRRRFVGTAKPLIGRAQQLHRVRLARA